MGLNACVANTACSEVLVVASWGFLATCDGMPFEQTHVWAEISEETSPRQKINNCNLTQNSKEEI